MHDQNHSGWQLVSRLPSVLPSAGPQDKTALVLRGERSAKSRSVVARASERRPSRKGGMAAALRTGTADSQDESRCSAIHRVKSNGGARKF